MRLARLRRQTRHRILTLVRVTTPLDVSGPVNVGGCFDGRGAIAEIAPRDARDVVPIPIVASCVVPASATAASRLSVPAPPAPVRVEVSVLCRGRAMETGERGMTRVSRGRMVRRGRVKDGGAVGAREASVSFFV